MKHYEGRGLVKNVFQPEKNIIVTDFEIERSSRYGLATLKTSIN